MKYYVRSHVGLVRKNNEDSNLVLPPALFAVADGMGGQNAGEVASREAVSVLQSAYRRFQNEGLEPALLLGKIISEANSHVYRMSLDKKEYHGMGTTLTAVYFDSAFLVYVAQVGDSRLYIFRDGQLKQLTKDQTWAAELAARGSISVTEAEAHPGRSMLLQALGSDSVVEPVIERVVLHADDKLLLCSDGLYGMVDEDEILKILVACPPETVTEQLVNLALRNGGKDNITVLLLAEFGGEDIDG